MTNEDNSKTVLEAAKLAGCLLLENGAETYRAEETMRIICAAGGYPESEVVAFTTAVIISLSGEKSASMTELKRVSKRAVNLAMLNDVNTVSRRLTAGEISFNEAVETLRGYNDKKHRRFHLLRYCLWSALSCAFLTLVYGGGLFDAAAAFVCGVGVRLISSSFSRIRVYPFATSLIGSMFIATLSVAATSLFKMGSIDMIIVGAIVPLLPGIAMTNAIRDAIMGDLVSGSSRLTEVLLTAVGIASGCGLVFTVYIGLGGTL